MRTIGVTLTMLICLWGVSQSAFAETDPEEAQAAEEVQGDEQGKPKLICTRERVVGTNMKKRICRTPKAMEMESEDARRILDLDSVHGGGSGGPG